MRQGSNWTLVTDRWEAQSIAARARRLPWFNFDTETTGLDPHTASIRLAQFGLPEADGRIHSYLIDCYQVPVSVIRNAFSDSWAEGPVLIGHNLAFDLKMLMAYDIEHLRVYDTMIAAKVCEAGWQHLVGKHNLAAVAMRTIGVELDKAEQKSDWARVDLSDEQLQYAALDVQYPHRIAQIYNQIAQRDGLQNTIRLEMECVVSTARIEFGGMRTDEKKVQETTVLASELLEQEEATLQEIMGLRTVHVLESIRLTQEERDAMYARMLENYDLAKQAAEVRGERFDIPVPTRKLVPQWRKVMVTKQVPYNVGSSHQLKEWFRLKGIPIPLKKVKDPVTKQRVLKESLDEASLKKVDHPIGKALIAWRKTDKILNTYLTPMPGWVNPVTGNVHTQFNQVVATGRRSSYDPNLQNIPTRGSDLAKRMRGLFIPPPGQLMWISDFKQIELYLIAMLSRDPVFCSQIRAGLDLHYEKAKELFGTVGLPKGHPDREAWENGLLIPGVDPFSKYKKERDVSKTFNFAAWYGAWAAQLDEQSGGVLGVERAEHVLKLMHQGHPAIVNHFAGITQMSFELGYTTTIMGRRRYTYRPDPSDRAACSQVSREMNNFHIQGSGADCMKAAEVELIKAGIDLRMVVHDEGVGVCGPEEAEHTKLIVHRCMEKGAERVLSMAIWPYEPGIRIEAETVIARSWAEKG